jgi:hypothetical protein
VPRLQLLCFARCVEQVTTALAQIDGWITVEEHREADGAGARAGLAALTQWVEREGAHRPVPLATPKRSRSTARPSR